MTEASECAPSWQLAGWRHELVRTVSCFDCDPLAADRNSFWLEFACNYLLQRVPCLIDRSDIADAAAQSTQLMPPSISRPQARHDFPEPVNS